MIYSNNQSLLPKNNYVGFSITQGNVYRKKEWPLENVIELSKVLHHVNEDVCLGVELTIKGQEWIEIPQTKDIEVHRYEVVDIKPTKVLELYCVMHEKYEHIIYKTKDLK